MFLDNTEYSIYINHTSVPGVVNYTVRAVVQGETGMSAIVLDLSKRFEQKLCFEVGKIRAISLSGFKWPFKS